MGPLLLIFVTIAGTSYIALFDTGAAVSTINLQALSCLPEVPVVRNCNHIKIKAWNGTVSPCQGMLNITMHKAVRLCAFIISPEARV